jgi:hypothetical protein
MNSSNSVAVQAESAPRGGGASTVLASEAGIPFQPSRDESSEVSPFVEWLSLMEVVQMLCPVWPVRDQPMRGDQWRL